MQKSVNFAFAPVVTVLKLESRSGFCEVTEMYCPKCGQQQVSDEMRFCPRCGLQLGALTTLIANDGLLPVVMTPNVQGAKPSARKRGVRQGAKLMFISVVLLPIAIGLSVLVENPAPMIIPFTVFLAGFTWLLYSRLFGEETETAHLQASQAQLGTARPTFLPPQQSIPVNDLNRPPASTAEMRKPPSVTENTTRLLDDER
jgi:hypothetical protein